jgi:hypothetical protein
LPRSAAPGRFGPRGTDTVGEGRAVEPIEDLAARLAALERSNRLLTLALSLAFALSLLSCAMAVLGLRQANLVPETVQARRFVLVDEAGMARAVLERAESGTAQLVLTDA